MRLWGRISPLTRSCPSSAGPPLAKLRQEGSYPKHEPLRYQARILIQGTAGALDKAYKGEGLTGVHVVGK